MCIETSLCPGNRMHPGGPGFSGGEGQHAKLSGHKTTPTSEMTHKSSSGRFGADFGRKCTADGPNTGPRLSGPKARAV